MANFTDHPNWKEFRCKNIATIINNLDPDVIALQEIRKNNITMQHAVKHLLEKLPTTYHLLWKPMMSFHKGILKEGLCILSKLPPLDKGDITLPLGGEGIVEDKNMRGAVFICVAKGIEIEIINTHLSYVAKQNNLQQKALSEFLRKRGETNPERSLIVLGDLNIYDDNPIELEKVDNWRDVARSKGLSNTFPADSPCWRPDRILFTSKNLILERVEVGGRDGNSKELMTSDHLFLLAEFKVQI